MVANTDEAKSLRHFLESAPIGAVFDESDLSVLDALATSSRNYAARTVVSSQGDWANTVHIIKSGWGCIYRDLPDGDRQILDFPI